MPSVYDYIQRTAAVGGGIGAGIAYLATVLMAGLPIQLEALGVNVVAGAAGVFLLLALFGQYLKRVKI